MCSTLRNSLIYKEVFLSSAPRSKFVQNGSTGIRSEGERHLLLRKEYGKCGVTRLLRKECRVDSRRKWLPGACSEGEHHLLLRKEYGKCGVTRLLRKECRVDSRRKWLSGVCREGEHPLLLRKEYGKCGVKRLLRKECRVDSRRKWLSGVCREGEHPLLLQKELGNAGKRDSACYDYDQPAATDAIISPFSQQQATAVS